MDVSDLRKLNKKNCIIVISGRNPFYSSKYDYTSHKAYIFTSDANKANSYYYIPVRKKTPHGEEKEQNSDLKLEVEPIRISLSENKLIEIVDQIQLYQPLMDEELFSDFDDQKRFYEFIENEIERESQEKADTNRIISASLDTIQYIQQTKKDSIITRIHEPEDIEKIQQMHQEMEPLSDTELDAEYEAYPTEWEEENEIKDDFLNQLGNIETVIGIE